MSVLEVCVVVILMSLGVLNGVMFVKVSCVCVFVVVIVEVTAVAIRCDDFMFIVFDVMLWVFCVVCVVVKVFGEF